MKDGEYKWEKRMTWMFPWLGLLGWIVIQILLEVAEGGPR